MILLSEEQYKMETRWKSLKFILHDVKSDWEKFGSRSFAFGTTCQRGT